MSESQNKFCFVQFKLCQKTSPGEDIHITGNTPSLGLWNVNKSEKMVTNQQEYPLWKSKESIIVQQDSEVQYKYLIFRGGKFIRWENINENRKVKIGKYCKIVVMDPGSKIVHCISDPNLNNITNSEISKCDNVFYEDDSKFINMEEIDFNSIEIYNNDIISDQNININNNEEQFILSNKRNDLFFDNKEKKLNGLYEDLNVDNSNSNIDNNNIENNNILNNINYNLKNINSFDDIINSIEPLNNQLFNNIIISENQIINDNKELEMCKIDSTISEIKKNNSSDNIIFIGNDSTKNDLILFKNKNTLYEKIIICSIYLPVEIYKEEIIPLNDYIYPNLYNLKNNNDNIYYIGFLKNDEKINKNNKEEIYNKLKTEYKMYPINIDSDIKNELFIYFNDIIKPYLNKIKINIYSLINNVIYSSINEAWNKFNQIINKTIIELCGGKKSLILFFEYYFIFIPSLLIKGGENENDKINNFNNNINIEFLFLNQIPQKDRFIILPNYQKIIKSLLCSDLICFTSYNNCLNCLEIMRIIDDIEFQTNTEGDIILTFNINSIQNNNDNNSNSKSAIKNLILRVENIFPDYQLFKNIINEKEEDKFLQVKQKIENLTENDKYYIFLSIDDINYLPFIKIKLSGLKLFVDDALDEKQKIIFIQIITGEKKDKNNIYNNININEEKQEKENINELIIGEIKTLCDDINSFTENKIIEIIYKDINIYEKIYLLNKADCYIKTVDDINSPFSIYEYLVIKLIGHKIKIGKNLDNLEQKNSIKINNNKYKINKIIEKEQNEKEDLPIIEYIINNQIRQAPGIHKYISVNPFEIKSISNGLTKAYRNLINCHKKNTNINFMEEHSKENDFNYIKKYFCENKFQTYKFNAKDYQNNIINDNKIDINANKIKLKKIDINSIIKDYSESIKNNKQNPNQNNNILNQSNLNIAIISINLDFFLSNFSNKKEIEENQKLSDLFSNLIFLSINNKNNKIILFSKEDEFDLDDIIKNYIKHNQEKFKDTDLCKLNNLIIASSNGYSFKNFCNYIKEDINRNWAKILIDSEELKYSEKDIINNLSSYKLNCINLKIEHKSNKIYIYYDDCNKDQIDIYMDCFKNEIDGNEALKHILVVNKINNGYCIVDTLNYKALFISRLIKEIINKENYPKYILCFGFNKSDEILYKYLDEKKSTIEKYSKTNIYVNCIKLIKVEESQNENNNINIIEENYKSLFYEDNIDEIISLFKAFIDLESKNSK